MLKNWYHYFKKMIIDRVTEIDDTILNHHQEYKVLENQCNLIFKQLLALLPPEHHSLVFDFESIQVSLMNLSNEIIYRQGLIDGIRFENCIERLKRLKDEY